MITHPARKATLEAEPKVFWVDREDAPDPSPPLMGCADADLLVVGAGLTGLWTALLAKEQHPEMEVIVLEGERVAFGASGRNGGFLDASLTHGLANGLARWPAEMELLERLGSDNFAAIRNTLERYGISADLEPNGALTVATEPYQLAALQDDAEAARRFGWNVELLDRERVRAEVDSPSYLAGLWHRDGVALVDPARLAWGLARAASSLGVRIHERTPVRRLGRDRAAVVAHCEHGRVRAGRAVLATSAFPPLVRSIRRYVVPVYDYVLVTEPLDPSRRAAVGWDNRQGMTDAGNQFHYYRLTPDDRILWGGYDAVYHFGNGMGPQHDHRSSTYERLAAHFFETFPQLEGLRFTHRWGGAIDTCSRFSMLFGSALGGRAVYVVGFTGLGVGASRFGAQVALDLVHRRSNERTGLELVRSRPIPFPPEPLRFLGIEMTRRELARADRSGGRRGLWLRALDRLGMGYDS